MLQRSLDSEIKKETCYLMLWYQCLFSSLLKQGRVLGIQHALQDSKHSNVFQLGLAIGGSVFSGPGQILHAQNCGNLELAVVVHQVAGHLLQHILVGHDELLGRVAIRNVGQDAQGLLLDFRQVVTLQNENDGLQSIT